MAFFYLVLILIIIPFIVVFFLAGIILLIIGIVNKSKPKNAGRKFPTVCMSLGGTLLVLPALIVAIGIVPRIFGGFYSSVPEHWQNAWVGDTQAADEAIKALMQAAGNGGKVCILADGLTDPKKRQGAIEDGTGYRIAVIFKGSFMEGRVVFSGLPEVSIQYEDGEIQGESRFFIRTERNT